MRNIKLDLSRGILIIYIIVIIHGVFWLNLIPIPYSTALLLEMPLIFLVSGYTYGLSSKNKSEINLALYRKYSKARITRIIIPYLAYAFVCAILYILYSESTDYIKVILAWLNPLSYGGGHSISTLNWHLWFIPHFLIVTMLLPVVKIKLFAKISTISSFVFLYIFFLFNSYYETIFTTSLFYFIWAYLGYKISFGLKFTIKQLLFTGIGAGLILFIAKFGFNASLNMQVNKFPPNFLFLVFSLMWSSIILLITQKISSYLVNYLAKNRIIRIFTLYGYSLYIWQGIGYAVALCLQNKFHINSILTWLIAIILTIIFGLLASPIEKIRWTQSAAKV